MLTCPDVDCGKIKHLHYNAVFVESVVVPIPDITGAAVFVFHQHVYVLRQPSLEHETSYIHKYPKIPPLGCCPDSP